MSLIVHNHLVVGDTLETKVTGITGIKLGDSYRCMSGVTYNLTSQSSTVQLTLTDLQVQAFNFTMPEEFGKGMCMVFYAVFVHYCYLIFSQGLFSNSSGHSPGSCSF